MCDKLLWKSLGKCMCVSKKWAALIREKDFRARYLLHSMTRPRLLFLIYQREDPNVLFHSIYQEKEPLLLSCQHQTRITLEPESEVCAVLRGLVCIESPFKIMICNPGTKKFLALPELRERYQDRDVTFSRTYLGYDEATDVFKVLCLTNKSVDNIVYTDYRVFTVGSGEDCWRTIAYKQPIHILFTGGLSKDGVLYFGALSRSDGSLLISFNLSSEELNVIELPKPITIWFDTSLVNYNGEIALVNDFLYNNGEIKIWVRNKTAGDWREEHILIPRWSETVGVPYESYCFRGTIVTGELVFALHGYIGSMFVLYYDTITQHLRKFKIDGLDRNAFHYVSTFLDHVDSLSFM